VAVLVGSAAGASPGQTVAPPWQLAAALGRNEAPVVNALATDAHGNVYLAGFFYDSLCLGSLRRYASGVHQDGFVAKWNAATAGFEWAVQVGGTEAEELTAVAVEGDRVYVAGYFNSRTGYVGRLPVADEQGRNAQTNAFVAKLTAAGGAAEASWVHQLGNRPRIASVAVQGSTVYVGGSFYGTAAFGPTQLADVHVGQLGGLNGFVAKYTDTGAAARGEWALPAGVVVSHLAVGQQGLYAAGAYNGTPAEFGRVTLPSHGAGNVYVAKLADAGAAGSLTWLQHTGELEGVYLRGLAVWGSSVYLGGSFSGRTLRFGATTLTNARHGGGTDLYVAKLADVGAAGEFAWAYRAGGQGQDECAGLAANETGVYLAGIFYVAPADFGATRLPNVGSADLFVTQLQDAGPTATFTWAQSLGGPARDAAWAVAVSGLHVYVAGHLGTPVRVGPTTVQHTFLGRLLAPGAGPVSSASAGPGALEVYPNPTQAGVFVRLPPLPGVATATLTLFDARGRALRHLVLALPAAGGAQAWPLSGIPRGLYVLHVQAGKTSTSQRLVVE
jgi:hypothetical protein